MLSLEQVIAKLHLALDDPDEIQSAARALNDFVNVEEQVFEQLTEPVKDLLADLSFDLDYFEPHPKYRREDSAFYGPARAKQEIRTALEGLRREGAA